MLEIVAVPDHKAHAALGQQFLNITLSHDNRTVLLNDEPFFPTLPTVPTPPKIRVPQVRPDFSYYNLSTALQCQNPLCLPGRKETPYCADWCWNIQLDMVPIDYLYTTSGIEYSGNDTNAEAQYWEFNIDAIGGFAGHIKDSEWGFDSAKQKMLKVVVEGTEVRKGSSKTGQDTLFSPMGEEKTLEYRIVDVTMADREFQFSPRTSLSFFQRIARFFGNDVWESKGRLVYIRDEWEIYGKAGTLRSMFGDIVHWYYWDLTAIITASAVSGLLALYGFYRLFIWIREQRELMKWDGMDDVWDKLRREREEEENALLHGYRDEPGEGSSPKPPRYTDDLDIMKPLPKKPLPEKPLPDVPLIDA